MTGAIVAFRTKCRGSSLRSACQFLICSNHLELSPASKNCASADEVDIRAVGNDASVEAHGKKLLNGFSAVGAVVERALVYVHSDEAISQRGVEVAGKLHGVGQGLLTVVQCVLDAIAERVGCGQKCLWSERTADCVAPERERQAGLFAPPLAEIEQLDEAVVGVGELAFVDDQAGVELARGNGGDDLIEWDDRGFDLGGEELEGEIGGGEGAGDGDAGFLNLWQGELAAGDGDGAGALP